MNVSTSVENYLEIHQSEKNEGPTLVVADESLISSWCKW
jgi:hypothetical protein